MTRRLFAAAGWAAGVALLTAGCVGSSPLPAEPPQRQARDHATAPAAARVAPAAAPIKVTKPPHHRAPSAPLEPPVPQSDRARTPPPAARPAADPAAPNRDRDAALQARMRAAIAAKGPGYVPRTHHTDRDGQPTFVNRLIFESSPYLLQHAHNPVDWHPWGDEAFAEAKQRGVPVLLSVGYATCHWCHVMEGESFEDLEIARFMNAHFVCIKVDREERPDVDSVYMAAVQMLTGRGGWPMTIVMDPARRPFFAGTYFPPRDGARGARKGFLTILRELSKRYADNPAELLAHAKAVSQRLQAASAPRPAAEVPDAAAIGRTVAQLLAMHDPVEGGFGRRPKFPRPVTLDLLLRYDRRATAPRARQAVILTLDKMADGGIHDQIGGGFCRYSTDQRWLVPHFEKMLYDNAQLARTYLAAWQITGAPRFADTARSTLDYALREMRDPSGAFWSATDADSEGHEGRFFVWTAAELNAALGPRLGAIAARFWGVSADGNFEGRNILHRPEPAEAVAKAFGMRVEDLNRQIREAAATLYAIRKKRIPPLTDDKVLTAWNGLMVSALARGAFILDQPAYATAAAKAADVLLTRLRTPDGRLLRTWRQGSAAHHTAYLEDYAFLGEGLLDLFEATSNPRWLKTAIRLHDTLIEHYQDPIGGGFFRTADDAEKLLTRAKPDYDGAEPSGNAVAAQNLLRLYEYTLNPKWKKTAERTLGALSERITAAGPAVPAVLSALDAATDRAKEVVMVETPNDSGAALWEVLRRTYLPNRMVVRLGPAPRAPLTGLIPTARDKIARHNRATAYVCEAGVCQLPTSDPAVFATQLQKPRPYPPPAR